MALHPNLRKRHNQAGGNPPINIRLLGYTFPVSCYLHRAAGTREELTGEASAWEETLRRKAAQGDKLEGDSMAVKGWIEVSDTYCKGCELCISACPQDVMELDMSRLTPKGYHPAHTFKEGCTGCAICALVCPDAAITVYREVTKAVPVATASA